MAIPVAAPGGSFTVPRVTAIFPRHHGTIFHGKQAAVELIVRVLACLAEGLGIRATARVFEVDAEHGAGLAGGSGRAAAGLFRLFPL